MTKSKPKINRGNYQVTRMCCTSGMCISCRAVGDLAKRKRMVHTYGVSKAWAQFVAGNWQAYGAKVEQMKVETA